MPPPRTSDEFLELVRKSGVLEDKRLTAALDRLRAGGDEPPEPVKMADLLIRDGVLTRFQAEQFLQGKWRKFTIGKYRVLERLGAGGMGSVYLCEHILMRRRVAVKVLPEAKAKDSSSLERFHREARAVAALDHPNIVRAYDIDREENLHFLVMEHVDGPNLQEIVKRTGPMDVFRAAHYMRQAALGLQHAHEQGLVHRDIKPGNILVDRNGIVKVLDMGLARFFNDEEDMLTKKYDENVLGTADYLAPEQALDSHGVDIRADIYSLGGTFYFCITGRTPFAEGTVAQKLIWHQTRLPRPVQSLRPEIPDGIAAIIERMMAKSPDARYQSPQELADALAPYTEGPIPLPVEQEMPLLSPAALRSSPSSSSEQGTRTGDSAPPTRKIASGSSSEKDGPIARQVAAEKALEPPPPMAHTPTSLPPTVQSRPPTVAVPRPPAVKAATSAQPRPPTPGPAATSEPSGPTWYNGAPLTPRRLTTPALGTAEQAALSSPESTPTTEQDLPFEELPSSLPPRRRQPPPQRSTLFWVSVGLGGLAVVAGLATLVYFLVSGGKPREVPREPLRLTSSDARALIALLQRARSGDRIILTTDSIRGSGAYIDNLPPNITIEPEPGKSVVWSFAPNKDRLNFLLFLQGPDLTLRGITFDGEGKIATGLTLYSDCPGTRIEGCTFRGFTGQGISIANCQGAAARPVALDKLTFETTDPSQTAIRFSINPQIPHIPKIRFVTVSNWRITGPGQKATAIDPGKVIGPGVTLPDSTTIQPRP